MLKKILYLLIDFGNGILEINPGKLTHDLYIRIVDDALIEPFEFFKLDISDISPSKYSKALDKVIYIEDNDCKINFYKKISLYLSLLS